MPETFTFRSKGSPVTIKVVSTIEDGMQQLVKVSDKTQNELFIKMGVQGAEMAAKIAPKAKAGSPGLSASHNPDKGGKGKRGAKSRLYFALGSQPGVRGTSVERAKRGTFTRHGRRLIGYTRRKSGIGFGAAVFLAARQSLVEIGLRYGVKGLRPTSKRLSGKARRAGRAIAAFDIRKKFVEIINGSSSATSSRHGEYQAALSTGIRIAISRYLFNIDRKMQAEARKLSAR